MYVLADRFYFAYSRTSVVLRESPVNAPTGAEPENARRYVASGLVTQHANPGATISSAISVCMSPCPYLYPHPHPVSTLKRSEEDKQWMTNAGAAAAAAATTTTTLNSVSMCSRTPACVCLCGTKTFRYAGGVRMCVCVRVCLILFYNFLEKKSKNDERIFPRDACVGGSIVKEVIYCLGYSPFPAPALPLPQPNPTVCQREHQR